MDDHPDFGSKAELFMHATIAKRTPSWKTSLARHIGFSGDVAACGGKLVVPTALLNDSIADAGFFVQMALAAITPVAILNKKHPLAAV